MKRCDNNSRGQVWVETVIYTLIAFALMGMVLGFVKPKIESMQDKALIEQSIQMLKQIDSTISAVSNNPSGNRRQLEVNLNKGVLKFDGVNDKISINILTKEAYSEPGVEITNGEVKMNTTKVGSNYDVALYKIYSENKTVVVSEVVGGVLTEVTKIIKAGKNITLDGTEESKSVTKSATVKEIFITNNGYQNNMTIVNIQIQ